ncbi:hypothetical protein VPH35_128619 [Triticum aestivum]|uniref:uncharacterized protein isoform X2 n=2 Tax=Triticum aestivum TaxID=4565 RepID=UPI001D034749|nr:uncharacterized protein LOC123162068 isoform X2 [Triticum aestivum]
MVLAAAGEARGGRAPTAAERALVAEARGRLAASVAVVEVRPKELYPREAVRALVEDLGLGRARDPAAMGYRPCRASIAERILLTKRKMEQVKESLVRPTTNVPQTTPSSATAIFQDGASKSTAELTRNLSAAGSFPASTPTPVTMSSSILKQSRPNETPAGVSSSQSANLPSIVSLPPVGSANIEVEKAVNCPNFRQSGATIGQTNKSAHFTATRSSQSRVQSSTAGKSHEKKAPSAQPVNRNIAIGDHVPPGAAAFFQQEPCFSNHNTIVKNVQLVLHQPANHPSWTVPSTEYMHARLDCQICKTFITDVESLLVCDACERGVHLKCLKQDGNEGLSIVDWYCPTCVTYSKGKPLPPKYGKVTRTIVTSKARGVTSQRAPGNPRTKDSEEVAGNGSFIKHNSSEPGRSVRNSDMLALDTASSKTQSASASEYQKENTKHTDTLFKQKEGHGPPSRSLVTKTMESSSQIESSGGSTYSAAGNLSEQSHKQREIIELLPCAVNSVNDSTLQTTAIFDGGNSEHSFIDSSEMCGIEGNSDQLLNKDEQTTSSSITPADQTHQEDVAADIGIGCPQDDETTEVNAMSEHNNVYLVKSNMDLCAKHEVMAGPKSEALGYSSDLGDVDWVGDALKVVGNITYYNSCIVDGITYNLQDHILIGSKDGKSAPSKLQSLWEEHDSQSKLAMVNTYFFASDIPESATKPCSPEENEVYASNDQRTVMVSSICGSCDVLHVDKFREETNRRNQVVSSDSKLHPIFFGRWKYDECTGNFVSVDSSMGF